MEQEPQYEATTMVIPSADDAALSHQWISINERLPEPDEHVLAAVPADFADPDRYEVAYWDGEDWYTTHGEHIRPTHWANIPPPCHKTNSER